MANWIAAMLALQSIDLKIRDINTRLTLLPKELAELKAKRDRAVAEVNDAANSARKVELKRKEVESQIEALNAENAKLRQQSALVKKNNEYQAMLAAIALNTSKISNLEGQVIELLDNFETAKKSYQKLKSANSAVVDSVRGEFEELIAFSEELKKELAEYRKKRPAAASMLGAESLSRYDHLLAGKDGKPPLVAIKNGICDACHLRVTPQALANIHKGAVASCDNCMHFIYLEEEE